MNFVLVGIGLALLIGAGDALVKGAVNLSLRLGIPALIVSLTIVAFGTSAPELLISIDAVLNDVPGIALGNVVGSNIANVFLVLGVPALLVGFAVDGSGTRRSYVTMLMVTLLFIAVCFFGTIGWPQALILLAAMALVLGDQLRDAMKTHRNLDDAPQDEIEGADPSLPAWKIALFLVIGIVGLPVGANLFIDGARQIAQNFGVSDTVIGLTLVAIGTSLPELATTVVAAFRKQSDVAFGNVIGSNIFNLLFIIGITGLVGDVPVDETILRIDLWVMLFAAVVLAPFAMTRLGIGRLFGASFLLIYGGYLYFTVVS